MTASARVQFSLIDQVGVITLSDSVNRNSMTEPLLSAFADSVQAAKHSRARAVVVTGEGEFFSAGADLRAMTQRGDGLPHARSLAMYAPFLSILELDVPVIAGINGHCVGGGFGLALLCDLRVGVAGAKYGANFSRLGLHPGMGVTWTLPRIVGPARAQELLYTGRLFDGAQACEMGILLEVVDDARAAAMRLANQITAAAPLAIRLTKRTLRRTSELDPAAIWAAAEAEAYAQAETLGTSDAAEGVAALLGKRAPVFTGQ